MADKPALSDLERAHDAETLARVQPSREEVARIISETESLTDDEGSWALPEDVADAVLALLPGRTEAEVKAEALREAATEIDALYFGPDQAALFTTGAKHKWGATQAAKRLRARAARIEKEADRPDAPPAASVADDEREALIERLIREVPAHISGEGLRIDADDLRAILRTATGFHRTAPATVEAAAEVISSRISRDLPWTAQTPVGFAQALADAGLLAGVVTDAMVERCAVAACEHRYATWDKVTDGTKESWRRTARAALHAAHEGEVNDR